jgi:micrococcal nuclease
LSNFKKGVKLYQIWAVVLEDVYSLSLSLAFLSLSLPAIAQTITGAIVSVGDGDTLRVRTPDKTLTVRLSCVDAPEMAQAPYGQAASARLKQLLPVGQSVAVQVVDTDRYGRSVAKIFKGNTSINVALVQEGQAAVYRQYLGGCPELRDRLLSAEASAKQQRLGLWAQANPVMPWEFRRSGSAQSSSGEKLGQQQLNKFPPFAPMAVPKPAKDYDCNDFKSQKDAQRVFNAYPGDPFKLDQDRDGIACESLR